MDRQILFKSQKWRHALLLIKKKKKFIKKRKNLLINQVYIIINSIFISILSFIPFKSNQFFKYLNESNQKAKSIHKSNNNESNHKAILFINQIKSRIVGDESNQTIPTSNNNEAHQKAILFINQKAKSKQIKSTKELNPK